MKRHKKSIVLTYFLSFIPGVGFMYRGFMKRGFSYLALFLGVLSILNWLDIGILAVVPVLIWFYAFFDQINTFSASEQEQIAVHDTIIFSSWGKQLDKDVLIKNQRMIGGILVILGAFILMRNVYFTLVSLLPDRFQPVLFSLMRYTPQMILSCVILYFGTRFLQGNAKLVSIFKKTLTKQDEELIAKTNVVYYMEKGSKSMESDESIKTEEKSFAEILEETSREQLLKKAKDLLNDDIYQSIHIESAAALEEAPVIEKAAEIEKPAQIDKVEVEKCPDIL